MNLFSLDYKYFIHPKKGIQVRINDDLSGFNESLLNIGDLRVPSKDIEALSVMFDLEGFTKFTRQVDPQLAIPNFIADFFRWLFYAIKRVMSDSEQKNILWAELPFFSKFMGDGALFLWRIDLDKIVNVDKRLESSELEGKLQEFLCNIIASMLEICAGYSHDCLNFSKKYVDFPTKLRCGIARGKVFPIGGGLDFVGPCMNICTRLQKCASLSFVFSARGVDVTGFDPGYRKLFTEKRIEIRGIGDNELIWVKSHFSHQICSYCEAELKCN
jgi:hypothetical protein